MRLETEEEEESLLTAEQVARLLNVKPSTIYDRAYRGDLPVIRLWNGGRRALVRFRRKDILNLVEASICPARGNDDHF